MDAVSILRTRRSQWSQPQQRSDKYKIWLVISAWGLRNVYTAGAMAALEHFGYRNCFDAVYGSSSGSSNWCYFLWWTSHISARGYDLIMHKEYVQKNLFNRTNLFKDKAVFDVDIFIEIFRKQNRINFDWFLQSPIPLNMIVVNAHSGEIEILNKFESEEDICHAIKSAVYIPVLGKSAPPYKGKTYVDGWFKEMVPWKTALADGCTHLVVLLTQTKDHKFKENPKVSYILSKLAYYHKDWLKRFPKLYDLYHTVSQRNKAAMDELKSSGENILPVFVQSSAPVIESFKPEKDRKKYFDWMLSSYQHMASLLWEDSGDLPYSFDFNNNPLEAHCGYRLEDVF